MHALGCCKGSSLDSTGWLSCNLRQSFTGWEIETALGMLGQPAARFWSSEDLQLLSATTYQQANQPFPLHFVITSLPVIPTTTSPSPCNHYPARQSAAPQPPYARASPQ